MAYRVALCEDEAEQRARLERLIQQWSRSTQIHYAEVESMYRQVRGWRHDYRNHIQVLKGYAAQGDLEAIGSYLNELDTDLHTVEPEAHIPVTLNTPELDLCVIIGNLMDNAIEASMTLPEQQRVIRIYMEMKRTQLYISCTNFTAAARQKKFGGRFRTTKGEGHGFGLLRMDGIVERHGGYLSRNSEDGAFTTEILLPQT